MIIYGIILSLIAGLSITIGGCLANFNFGVSAWTKKEVRHGIIAFGGGALLSAIALVLIPDGAEMQSPTSTLVTFFLGSISFMLLDIGLSKSDNQASQFVAMMLDFIPEAILLGVVVTQDLRQAIFLTLVISAQNLPEGYAAFTEIKKKSAIKTPLFKFLLVGLTGPLYVLLGSVVFVNHPLTLGRLMTFCAGGILYLIFEDIAPQVPLKKHWWPPVGTVLGFMVGLAGYLFLR